MGLMESLLLEWYPDRDRGLRWQAAGPPADPTTSSLWEHYQKSAAVTAPNVWTLPGAPPGGDMRTMIMPRLLEPLAYYEHGLGLYEQIPEPTQADSLVACAMRLGRASLALELAAEQLKFSYQEAYDIACDVMGPVTCDVIKPFDLVGRWMGAVGILGVTNQRFVEVKAVVVLLSQLPQDEEIRGFHDVLIRRATDAMDDPGPWLAAVQAQETQKPPG